MQYMKAKLYLRQKKTIGGITVEMVIWQLPAATPDRPHGFKYRLYCGRDNECLVRYDNESGKGDHIHYGNVEQTYRFVSADQLISDFETDVMRLLGDQNV